GQFIVANQHANRCLDGIGDTHGDGGVVVVATHQQVSAVALQQHAGHARSDGTVVDCRSHRRQRVHQLGTRGGERSGHHGGVVVGFCPCQDLSHVSSKETGLVFGPRVLGLGGRPHDVSSSAHQRGQSQND